MRKTNENKFMTNKHEFTNGKILEAELCYKIVGAIYNVANKYGNGLKEIIYQKALSEEFSKAGIKFESQKHINIYSLDTGKQLGLYVPDFVIENKVILEIKSKEKLTQSDIGQQRGYLRASIFEICYLVNFGSKKVDIRRSIYTNDRKSFVALIGG